MTMTDTEGAGALLRREEVGTPGGVAELDGRGTVPPEQLPARAYDVQAASPLFGGLHPWDGVSEPIDSWPALQAAQKQARIKRTEMVIPAGIYYVSQTFKMTSTTGATTSSHRIRGLGTAGALLDPTGFSPVEIRPLPNARWAGPTLADPIFLGIGFGLEVESIGINGMGLVHDAWDFDQAFELRTRGLRATDTYGFGFTAKCLCNALLETLHVDRCGSNDSLAPRASVRIGRSTVYGISNTFAALNWHIERGPGVHLDLASGSNTDTDRLEWADFFGLHIEKLIDNTNLPTFSDAPAVLIGNARGVRFFGGTILGGNGPLVRVDRKIATNSVGDSYSGIKFIGTTFDGYHLEGSTPTRLIELLAGNGVTLDGCTFVGATSEFVYVGPNFGPDFDNGLAHYDRTRPGTTATKSIVDARPTTLAARGEVRLGATLSFRARGDRPSMSGGGTAGGLFFFAAQETGLGGQFVFANNEVDNVVTMLVDALNRRIQLPTGQVPGANPTSGAYYYQDPTRNKLTSRDSGGVVSEMQHTLLGSAVWDPPSIPAGGYASYVQPVTSAQMGQPAVVAPSVDPGDGVLVSAVVSSTGNVRITITNRTAAAVDLPSQTFTIKVFR